MTSSLPNTRTLLTSLFNTLTTPLPKLQPDPKPVNEPYDTSSNPLKALPPSQKALLSTMHVLFTPPMLLQALDLLDRGLVLRVIQKGLDKDRGDDGKMEESGQRGGEESVGDIFPPQANIHLPPSSPPLEPPPPNPISTSTSHPKSHTRTPTIYQVRSSQPPKSRFRDASSSTTANGSSSSNSGSASIYTVRLEAWSCSCAAFAFASFPVENVYPRAAAWDLASDSCEDGEAGGEGWSGFGREETDREMKREMDLNGDEDWEFGGLSTDGKDGGLGGGSVPCCKHLLACVLGERWEVLREYVKERVVGKEEMAGLGCEG